MKSIRSCIAAALLAFSFVGIAHAGPADAKINAAAELFQNGDYKGAAAKFKQALAQEPNNAMAWHFYGQCLAQMSDFEGARNAYDKVLRISPVGKLADRTREFMAQLPKAIEMVAITGKNYEIGKYEITQGEWQAVMGGNPSYFKNCGENCPVESVSWDDAQEFIRKLNEKSGKQYRLPTNAEWEYACYGGKKTDYCGSDDIDEVAWYGNNGEPGGNSNGTTHPVGQKKPNGYGLYDMSGNVGEWVQDCFDGSQKGRTFRGGTFSFGAMYIRTDFRPLCNFSNVRADYAGLRLARTVP